MKTADIANRIKVWSVESAWSDEHVRDLVFALASDSRLARALETQVRETKKDLRRIGGV